MEMKRLRMQAPLAAVLLAAATALADVDLRVESRPSTGPIEAFVRVTAEGKSVQGLEPADFAMALDGRRLGRFSFRLPPDQDPTQQVSIVLVFADGRAVESAIPAIERLPEGTFVSIVRARYEPGDPTPWLRLHHFTRVDGGSGSQSLTEFLRLSIIDLSMLRYGSRTPHLDFLAAGLDQLEMPGIVLPRGPKAVVMVGNGRHVESWSGLNQSELMVRASELGVPVFTIGTADFSDRPEVDDFMSAVSRDTGGRYFRADTTQSLDRAYRRIWSLLRGAYRLSIAPARVTDCDSHLLEVTVHGMTASAPFVRCDTTPDPLEFRTQEGVRPDSLRVSNAATITGIESPVEVLVYGGGYSLGCNSSFTRSPGTARAGDLVCVRHRASPAGGELTETTLVVGGVASRFYSTTRVATP